MLRRVSWKILESRSRLTCHFLAPKPQLRSLEYSSLLGMVMLFLEKHNVFIRYLFGGRGSLMPLEQLATLLVDDIGLSFRNKLMMTSERKKYIRSGRKVVILVRSVVKSSTKVEPILRDQMPIYVSDMNSIWSIRMTRTPSLPSPMWVIKIDSSLRRNECYKLASCLPRADSSSPSCLSFSLPLSRFEADMWVRHHAVPPDQQGARDSLEGCSCWQARMHPGPMWVQAGLSKAKEQDRSTESNQCILAQRQTGRPWRWCAENRTARTTCSCNEIVNAASQLRVERNTFRKTCPHELSPIQAECDSPKCFRLAERTGRTHK